MSKYDPTFTVKKLYDDTYSISDSGLGQGPVFMYLLVGSHKALLIDSGYGLLDLPKAVATVTDKEVICICTHGHVDHALGARQFTESYLHSSDFDVYTRHTDAEFLRDVCNKGILMSPPKSMLNHPNYQRNAEQLSGAVYPPLLPLDGVEQFDLGDRVITWRPVPGHTPGSIAVIDEANHTVFDGDSAPVGAWLFLDESSPLPDYMAVLQDYLQFCEDKAITKRYAGHSGLPMSVKNLRQLIRCVQIAHANPKKGIKVKSFLGDARIVFAGGSMFFCGR